MYKMKLFLIFGIMGILGFLINGVMHEQVHVAIFKSYGIESKVDYFDFPDFVTHPEEPCPSEECNLANNINEAIAYNLSGFYLLFFVAFLFIIGLLEDNRKLNDILPKPKGRDFH